MRRYKPAAILLLLLAALASRAQELEPRAYSPSPVGTHFVVAGFSRSTGDVLFDPAVLLENASARLTVDALGYGQTFGWLGRMASVAIAVPYVGGSVSGDLAETRRSAERSGLADMHLRLVSKAGGDRRSSQWSRTRWRRSCLTVQPA